MSRPADPRRRPAAALALVAGGVGLAVALAVPAAATVTNGPSESWAPEIALAGGDDRGVVLVDGAVRPTGTQTGELVLAPRRTVGSVDAVSGEFAADVPGGSSVVVEVRGLGADGRWGPWVTLPRSGHATLGRSTRELSVRVLLRRGDDGATPVLRGLWLTSTGTAPPTRTTTETTTETTTVTTTVPVTLVPTTTATTPTTACPTTTTPTTTTTPPSTTRPPTTTTKTVVAPPSTTSSSTDPEEPDEPDPTTTTTTRTTTTTPIPPRALVPDLPPDPPYVPSPAPAAKAPSWWGADLLAWLARAF